MFDLPPDAIRPELPLPDSLLNPPAIVREVNLEETTFGPASRFFIQPEREALQVVDQAFAFHAGDLAETQEKQVPVEVAEAPVPLPPDQSAPFYDGSFLGAEKQAFAATSRFADIRGMLPKEGVERVGGTRIVYINGISTSPRMAYQNMQCTADRTGKEVVGIYNATDGDIADVLQAVGDKWSVGNNKAVDTLVGELRRAIDAGEPLHLIGDSHGALIVSRSLEAVVANLKADGWQNDAIETALGKFKIETFGGAAWGYTDGPQYVHYINEHDPVPFHFGLTAYGLTEQERATIEKGLVEPTWMKNLTGVMNFLGVNYFAEREPGKDARIIRFKQDSDEGWLYTHIATVYLQHRQPFDQAYKAPEPTAAAFELLPFAKIAIRFALTGLGLYGLGRAAKATFRRMFKKQSAENAEQIKQDPESESRNHEESSLKAA